MQWVLGLSLEDEKNKALPLFAGLCFFLSLIDVLTPKPVPFFRLGLANLALMLAMDVLSVRSFFLLLLVKVAGQAILSGTIFSYVVLLSFVGTLSSGVVMFLVNFLRKKRFISFIGLSMLGALASNISQLLLARFVVFGEGAWLILPPLLLVSLISSFILGIFANSFYISSIWYESLLTGEIELKSYEKNLYNIKRKKTEIHRIVIGFVLIALLLFVDLPEIKALIFGAGMVLCIAEKIRLNIASLLFTSFFIIVLNLFPPYGYVIFQYKIFGIFPIMITREALLQGVVKALLFEGLLYISKWMLRYEFNIKGAFGEIIQRSVFVFQRLMTCKKEIKLNNLVGSLDSVLLSLDKII